MTVNGRVELMRIRWHGVGTGSVTPLDEALDRAEKTFSHGVQEMVCRLDQSSSSFDKTAENMLRLTALRISGETVRQLVETNGRAVADALRKGRWEYQWTAEDCRLAPHTPPAPAAASHAPTPSPADGQAAANTLISPALAATGVSAAQAAAQAEPAGGLSRVYMGCDGVKVPTVTEKEKQKRRKKIKEKRRRSGKRCRPLPAARPGSDQEFKEIRIVTAYSEDQGHRAVAVNRGDCEAVGQTIRNLATGLRLDQADETIANFDGAPWIRNQFEFHQPVRRLGLDWYHLKDQAQRTRREVFGDDAEAGQAWLTQFTETLMEHGVDRAWGELVEWRQTLKSGQQASTDRLLNYIAERREIICYREFRALGWQIGSGPTEAQCKTTTQRVKGRGRRWDLPHAEAIMALSALEASDEWARWWSTPSLTTA